jgi:hypothetical protein
MAFALSARPAAGLAAAARPKRAAVRAAAINRDAPMYRAGGASDAPANATAPVSTPFDDYRFAPIREATVRGVPPTPGVGFILCVTICVGCVMAFSLPF